MKQRVVVALAAALATVAVAAASGCSNGSSQNAASPARTQTQTVTQTVTVRAKPRHPRVLAVSPMYTSFAGAYFTIDYPETWNVDAADADKGGYFDTTIRSSDDPNLMIRVDLTPGASADVTSNA